jgi:hypothetical protein
MDKSSSSESSKSAFVHSKASTKELQGDSKREFLMWICFQNISILILHVYDHFDDMCEILTWFDILNFDLKNIMLMIFLKDQALYH